MAKLEKVNWDSEAWNDFCDLIDNHQKSTIAKIIKLIKDIRRNGVETGIGKPEQLKHELAGLWSREITGADRLVYYAEDDTLFIVQCITHYKKI